MPTAAYGSWPSPISAERIAGGSVSLSSPHYLGDGSIAWLEMRPAEGGRYALIHRSRDGATADLLPTEMSARSKVHEYGGGSWLPCGTGVVFTNFEDQRLWRLEPGGEPEPITAAPTAEAPKGSVRFADGRADAEGARVICVRETHPGGGAEAVNEIVAVPSAGGIGEVRVLRAGNDFYACPRISPDGSRLAWIEWPHPQMPWDGSELWCAEIGPDGSLSGERALAGGAEESIWQPGWSPAGELHFVSDRSGFWNLYREPDVAITDERAEYGYPHWVFGGATYAFTGSGEIAAIRVDRADERLFLLGPGGATELDLPYRSYGFPSLDARGERLLFVAASPSDPSAVVDLDLGSGERTVLRSSLAEPIDPGLISIPRAIEFPTPDPDGSEERTAHAFFYPPANDGWEAPEGELPPLIVSIHGGPSAAATAELDEEVLYWTSRGIGVVDVNYGGSTGFGRAYRERLRGTWGVVDRADCEAAAAHLGEQGLADPERLAIHGGSAGGYTTLCALSAGEVFAAGASYYGVADAETLATDTHKFESRYLDGLIGPYPDAAATYRERSPIHYVGSITAPVIIFQGTEDEVVPLAQAEQVVAALEANGVPHVYMPFEGEQHGFRRAETIVACLQAELAFYGRIFGFEPADELPALAVRGLD